MVGHCSNRGAGAKIPETPMQLALEAPMFGVAAGIVAFVLVMSVRRLRSPYYFYPVVVGWIVVVGGGAVMLYFLVTAPPPAPRASAVFPWLQALDAYCRGVTIGSLLGLGLQLHETFVRGVGGSQKPNKPS